MVDTVTPFRSPEEVATPVNEHLVKALELMLEKAKTGEVHSGVAVFESVTGFIRAWDIFPGSNAVALLGEMVLSQREVERYLLGSFSESIEPE